MKTRRLAACSTAILACCVAVVFAATPDDPKAQVEAALKEYARLLQATDTAGLAAFYAEDGELLNPGRDPVKGPDSVRLYLASFGKVHIETASMTPDSTEVHGDMALQWGSYAQLAIGKGDKASNYTGRFVVQWSRQADGRWLIRRMLTQPSPQK